MNFFDAMRPIFITSRIFGMCDYFSNSDKLQRSRNSLFYCITYSSINFILLIVNSQLRYEEYINYFDNKLYAVSVVSEEMMFIIVSFSGSLLTLHNSAKIVQLLTKIREKLLLFPCVNMDSIYIFNITLIGSTYLRLIAAESFYAFGAYESNVQYRLSVSKIIFKNIGYFFSDFGYTAIFCLFVAFVKVLRTSYSLLNEKYIRKLLDCKKISNHEEILTFCRDVDEVNKDFIDCLNIVFGPFSFWVVLAVFVEIVFNVPRWFDLGLEALDFAEVAWLIHNSIQVLIIVVNTSWTVFEVSVELQNFLDWSY